MSEADPDPDPDTADREDDSNTDIDVNPADFAPGALVVDREDDDSDSDPAVVLNTTPVRAADWTVYRLETTVAEDNPTYPADDPVVVVAFRDYLEEHLPEWDDRDGYWSMAELNEQGIHCYAFPASRLEPLERTESEAEAEPEPDSDKPAESASAADPDTDREHERTNGDREDDREPVVDLDGLTDRLTDAGCAVQYRGNQLRVSKLGEMYQIDVNGEITGDGALRERLETVVEEFALESEGDQERACGEDDDTAGA